MRSLVYFQSGGPTAVINCSLYGVIAEAFKSNEIGGVYGSIHGVEGSGSTIAGPSEVEELVGSVLLGTEMVGLSSHPARTNAPPARTRRGIAANLRFMNLVLLRLSHG